MATIPVSPEWQIVSPGPLRSIEELEAAAQIPPGPSLAVLARKSRSKDAWTQAEVQRFQCLTMLEATLQDNLRAQARAAGWKYYHTRDSRGSDPGYPDTHLVRAGRSVIIECKRELEKVTGEQLAWLIELLIAGHEIFILRPSGWDAMLAVLR